MPVIKVKSEEVKIKVPLTTMRIEPTTQAKTVEPAIEEQLITPDEGVFALSSVTVSPVTSEIDENIKAENIKQGVSILGVDGTGAMGYHILVNDDPSSTGGVLRNILDIKIDTSERTDFSRFFMDFEYVKTFPVLNTSKATNVFEMFYGCKAIETPPLIDTSNVTNMEGFLRSCSSLKNVPNYNISKVNTMRQMFENCSILEEIPEWDTSNVENFENMFQYCRKFKRIHNINTNKATSLFGMFRYCEILTDVPELNAHLVTRVNYIFDGCKGLVNIGGLKDIGKAYDPRVNVNNSIYDVNISSCVNATEQSVINILNGLYDIASLGIKTQKCVLGSTNIAKLTSVEGQQALVNATAKGWTVS